MSMGVCCFKKGKLAAFGTPHINITLNVFMKTNSNKPNIYNINI